MSEELVFERAKTAEESRLEEAREKGVPWRQWGPYLSERQWGTVREDYSENGDAWNYFTHEQARSRPGSAAITSGCALHLPCGTARTRSSRRGCSA